MERVDRYGYTIKRCTVEDKKEAISSNEPVEPAPAAAKEERTVFKDEQLIKERHQEHRKKYTGIETGIYSGEEFLEFEETRLFQERVGVVLPVKFQDMLPEDAKKKYPSEQRPQIIKTNSNGTVNFAFNLLEQEIEEEMLEAAVRDFVRVMKRLYPTNICLKIEQGQGTHLPYASAEFTSLAVNENLYNMVGISPIGKDLLMFLFNCPFDKRTDWSLCMTQIRGSIADYSEEEEK